MAITLAEAKKNATEAYDPFVIDEFRKESALLDNMIFDQAVNPAGGGATLTYGYRRLKTQATAATRELNTEYTAQNVETSTHTTNLAVMGGSFEVDRVIASLGPAASGAVVLNVSQKIKAARTKFQDLMINGDTATDAHGFDGLDKALKGSSTELKPTTGVDWTDLDTTEKGHKALDTLDEFLSALDGDPTLLIGNRMVLAKVRSIIRRTSMYVKAPVEGLLGQNGQPIYREQYGNLVLIDAGEKAGSSDLIIPTVASGQGAGTTSLYAVRIGMDGFHGVTTVGSSLAKLYLPNFETAGAVKKGEVELGPVGVALKATKAAAVLRGIKVR